MERSLKLIKEMQADRMQQAKQEPAQTATTAKPQPVQTPRVAKKAAAGEFVFSTPANAGLPPHPEASIVVEKEPQAAMAA